MIRDWRNMGLRVVKGRSTPTWWYKGVAVIATVYLETDRCISLSMAECSPHL